MKQFTSAVVEVETEDAREARITALMTEKHLSREQAEAQVKESEEGEYVEFELDGRVMRAYKPLDGQLAFMIASLGRGQTSDQRFGAILNIMFACLRDDDQDWLEGRMLTRDPKQALQLEVIEQIFEHLTTEWFARPTQ